MLYIQKTPVQSLTFLIKDIRENYYAANLNNYCQLKYTGGSSMYKIRDGLGFK